MLQDTDRGAPTEIDAINGAVVRAGEAVGVETPVNTALWQAIVSLTANEVASPRPHDVGSLIEGTARCP
jgi:2-dehydropantoate 2-reductase